MRSRDANYAFSFRFFSLIFFYSSVLFADEYLISYRDVIINSKLYNHQFYISKSMQKCQGIKQSSFILENSKNLKLQTLLASQEIKFYLYTQQIGVELKDKSVQKNMTINSKTSITFKTKCFDVDVNENFVKIAYIKKEKN